MSKNPYETMFKDYDDILNVKDIQAILGISRKKVYKLLKDGTIQSLKPGRGYIVSKMHFIDYILGNKE